MIVLAGLVVAGGLGAVARFIVDTLVSERNRRPLPLGTLVINVAGSFLLGLLTGWVLHRGGSPDVRAVLGTGFLGGFTTFSTASVELVRLVYAGRTGTAIGLAASMIVLSLAAGALGFWLA